MQKIVPHLWFDTEAIEAAEFYTTLFPDSKISQVTTLENTPSGNSDVVEFTLAGFDFMAINAGPYFTINPSISFILNFDPAQDENAAETIEKFWQELSDGGEVLMEFGAYEHSPKYGWCKDKYGVSWQLMLTDPAGEPRPFITPSLMFTQDATNKAEEAIEFYTSVFKHAKVGNVFQYPQDTGPAKKGALMYGDFMLEDVWFAAMDSGVAQDFTFNEAISLLIQCETQEEIDYFWEKFSAVPEAEQCGWCKDKYGVSWQITSRELGEMLSKGTAEQKERVTEAFLKMKKFDLAELKDAFAKL